MGKAFVLIKTGIGKAPEVVRTLRSTEGVVSVEATLGPYDAIAVVEGETPNAIGGTAYEVLCIDGVMHTITCLAVSMPEGGEVGR